MIGLLGMARTATGWAVSVHLPDAVPPTPAPAETPPVVPPTATAKGTGCEANIVFPCTTRTPALAEWLVKAADCNCEYAPEDMVTAYCNECFLEFVKRLKSVDEYECDCGTVYRPPLSVIADVVEIQ